MGVGFNRSNEKWWHGSWLGFRINPGNFLPLFLNPMDHSGLSRSLNVWYPSPVRFWEKSQLCGRDFGGWNWNQKKIWIIKKMSPYCYTYMLNMLKIRLYFCFTSIQLNLCKMCFIIYSNHLTIFMLFYTNKCTCMHVLSIYIWLCVDIVIGKFVYDKTIQK